MLHRSPLEMSESAMTNNPFAQSPGGPGQNPHDPDPNGPPNPDPAPGPEPAPRDPELPDYRDVPPVTPIDPPPPKDPVRALPLELE